MNASQPKPTIVTWHPALYCYEGGTTNPSLPSLNHWGRGDTWHAGGSGGDRWSSARPLPSNSLVQSCYFSFSRFAFTFVRSSSCRVRLLFSLVSHALSLSVLYLDLLSNFLSSSSPYWILCVDPFHCQIAYVSCHYESTHCFLSPTITGPLTFLFLFKSLGSFPLHLDFFTF